MLCLIDIDRFQRDSRKGDEFQVRLLWYQAWNDLKNEGFWADAAILVVGCIAGMLRIRTREDEFSWQKPYTSIVHSSHLLSDHINAHLEYTRPQPVPSVPVYITLTGWGDRWMKLPCSPKIPLPNENDNYFRDLWQRRVVLPMVDQRIFHCQPLPRWY